MKTTKLVLLLLTALTIQTTAYSQVNLEWAARYIGANVYVMALDSMGNVIMSGHDGESPPGFVTVKFNSSGQFVWATRYVGGMPIRATPVSIAVDTNGNVYVGAKDQDYIVIKYNYSGVQQWARRYRGGGGYRHVLYDMTLKDNIPTIVVTGVGSFPGAGNNGCFTVKINNITGDSIWARRYTPVPTICNNIGNNTLTNIYICGKYDISFRDYLTLSYNQDGNLRWAKTWNGPANRWDVAYDIASDNNGNVYVTGIATVDSLDNEAIATIKYDNNGNQKWVRLWGGYSINEGRHIKTDYFGNVIVAGWHAGYDYDYVTIKYDSLGNQLWSRTYNGPASKEDFLRGLAVDKYGDVYVTGDVHETITLHKTATIKYDNNGNQKWLRKYPENDTISGPRAIIVDKNLNVFVGGTISAGAYGGMFVLKYSQPTAIEPISSVIPKEYKLYQNYPNPFNPVTRIKFDVPRPPLSPPLAKGGTGGVVTLRVYDLLGREIEVLVNGELKPGTYEVEWNAGGRPSGIYFYRLVCKYYMETKKMLLIK